MIMQFPIKDLKPASYNPRTISASEMEALMSSIKTRGFIEPIVVNKNPDRFGTIVGGHQRLKAVKKLLAEGIVPAYVERGIEVADYTLPAALVDLTEEQEKQANIALNKIKGKFKDDMLLDLLIEMKDSPTLTSTGFSTEELNKILDTVPQSTDVAMSTPKVYVECTRCAELKLQVMGHARRSGHPIRFQENADENDEKTA